MTHRCDDSENAGGKHCGDERSDAARGYERFSRSGACSARQMMSPAKGGSGTHRPADEPPATRRLMSLREGALFKLKAASGAKPARWQLRYFVIRDGYLLYYTTKPSDVGTPAGWLRLVKGLRVSAVAGAEPSAAVGRFAFDVVLPHRSISLRANSADEMAGWMSALIETGALAELGVDTPAGASPQLPREPRPAHSVASPMPCVSPPSRQMAQAAARTPLAELRRGGGEGSGKTPEAAGAGPCGGGPRVGCWFQFFDSEGHAYWHDIDSGESVWALDAERTARARWVQGWESRDAVASEEKAPDDICLSDIVIEAAVMSAATYYECWDEVWGAMYYCPAQTGGAIGDATWERPEGARIIPFVFGDEDA